MHPDHENARFLPGQTVIALPNTTSLVPGADYDVVEDKGRTEVYVTISRATNPGRQKVARREIRVAPARRAA